MIVREAASDRVMLGFIDPQIVLNLVGKPGVETAADAAEQALRHARDRTFSS